jgi:hypothetical protein
MILQQPGGNSPKNSVRWQWRFPRFPLFSWFCSSWWILPISIFSHGAFSLPRYALSLVPRSLLHLARPLVPFGFWHPSLDQNSSWLCPMFPWSFTLFLGM